PRGYGPAGVPVQRPGHRAHERPDVRARGVAAVRAGGAGRARRLRPPAIAQRDLAGAAGKPGRSVNTVPAGRALRGRAEPFSVAVDAAAVYDLRAPIRRTPPPEPAPGEPGAHGPDREGAGTGRRYLARG